MSNIARFILLAAFVGLNSECDQATSCPSSFPSVQSLPDQFSPSTPQDFGKEVGTILVRGKGSRMGNTLQDVELSTSSVAFNRNLLCVSSAWTETVDNIPGSGNSGEMRREWPKTVTVDLGGGVVMAFVRIPAGKFLMGSPEDEKNRLEDEKQHEVWITRPFYLSKYEVTQEQYEQIIGKNPSYFSADGGGKEDVKGMDTRRFPVEQVSWTEAMTFCRHLSMRHRAYHFRLPTEAEWEYACRAGTQTAFHFGSSLKGDKANCDGTVPYGTEEKGPFLYRTCRVGSYAANEFGLHDMHGNVWEWCADWHEWNYDTSNKKDPNGPLIGATRVLRGGSFCNESELCRAAYRRQLAPSEHGLSIGFRVAFSQE